MPRKIARRITSDYLHNSALYYLERYAASAGRVRRVLADKIRRSCRDHPDQDPSALFALIEPEIERLRAVSLLDDALLLMQLVQGYRARGLSSRMIVQKLRLKNFENEQVARALAASELSGSEGPAPEGDTPEVQAAVRYVQRRRLWPCLKEPPGHAGEVHKARQKSWAALARLGYDSDVIEQCFEMLSVTRS